MLLRWLAAMLCCVAACGQEIAAGKLLIADPASRDPLLAHAAVWLIYSGKEGAMGLVLNRPLATPLSHLFPELPVASARVYDGGPISSGVRALFRSADKPKDGLHLFADVYVTSSIPFIRELAKAGKSPDVFRVYAGYTGWSRGQLESEISRRALQDFEGTVDNGGCAGFRFTDHEAHHVVPGFDAGKLPAQGHYGFRSISRLGDAAEVFGLSPMGHIGSVVFEEGHNDIERVLAAGGRLVEMEWRKVDTCHDLDRHDGSLGGLGVSGLQDYRDVVAKLGGKNDVGQVRMVLRRNRIVPAARLH